MSRQSATNRCMTQMPEVGRRGFVSLTAGAIAALLVPG